MVDLLQLQDVLRVLLSHVGSEIEEIEYRIVGTAASLLHGVTLPVGDVDVLAKNRSGVDTFATLLSRCKCLTSPMYIVESRQYFCSFEINGVELEFSTVEGESDSDTGECTGSGPWTYYKHVSCDDHQIPVVALELRLITEISRQRPDRYVPIFEAMRSLGYEKGLLKKGLREREIFQAEHIDLRELWE
ncbi:MAG: hypothetical protein HN368_03175 [Spirochaetales bacterium]|nr:hypothetical protein [Spirochaetales bacterium]